MVKLRKVPGMANSSLNPNSDLVDVGYDSLLEAKENMEGIGSGDRVVCKVRFLDFALKTC